MYIFIYIYIEKVEGYNLKYSDFFLGCKVIFLRFKFVYFRFFIMNIL